MDYAGIVHNMLVLFTPWSGDRHGYLDSSGAEDDDSQDV